MTGLNDVEVESRKDFCLSFKEIRLTIVKVGHDLVVFEIVV